MTDFSAFRVLNFAGRKPEWPTWSEKLFAKAKHSGIKVVLLGKVALPKNSDVINERTEEEERMMRSPGLNGIAFTELVISIDVSSSSGKIASSCYRNININGKVILVV